MKKFVILSLAVILLAASVQSVFAAATDIQFYGYTWFRYTLLNQQFASVSYQTNKMSMERTYLRWKVKYEENIEGNITLDIPMKSGNTSNSDWNTLVKYAYIDVKQGIPGDGFFRVGVQPMYFCMIDRWEYPLIQKPVEDVNSLLSSADLGVSAQGFLPDGWGDWQVALYNGNGYAKPTEFDTNIASAANITVIPLPGLSVRGSIYNSIISSNETQFRAGIQAEKAYTGFAVNYYIGQLWLMVETIVGKRPNTNVNASTNAAATSLFAQYGLNEQIELAARLDSFDPNTDAASTSTSNALQTRTILGMNYKMYEDLLLQVNLERLVYEGGPDATTGRSDDTNIITQLKWSF